jgi:hypothetical protein
MSDSVWADDTSGKESALVEHGCGAEHWRRSGAEGPCRGRRNVKDYDALLSVRTLVIATSEGEEHRCKEFIANW